MKLKKSTLEVLGNFASINQGLVFKQGSYLRTMSIRKSIFATVDIEDEFPRDFAIYDLNEFLNTYYLFKDADVNFGEFEIVMKENNNNIRYLYSSPSVIISPPEKEISLDNMLGSFTLDKSQIDSILKASGTLRLKEVEIAADGLNVFNRGAKGNEYKIEMKTGVETSNPIVLSIDDFRMMPDDYEVEVYGRAVKFKSTKIVTPLNYFIVVKS